MDRVMSDMDRFYNDWLPSRVAAGDYPSLQGYIDDLWYAHGIDSRFLKGCK